MNMRSKCKQIAVYWGAPVSDGRGKWTFADPVEVYCRWEDTAIKYTDTQGEIKVSSAVVFLRSASVVVGGYMWLGRLADLTTTDDPTVIENALSIKQAPEVPSINTRETVRKAIL